MKKLVIFDVDGVLSNSYPPHRQFCEDMNQKYNCGLTIPENVVASPMDNLLRRAGFSEDIIPKLLEEYQNFNDNYEVNLFDGVSEMFKSLTDMGVIIGVVSSNYTINIKNALGDLASIPEDIFGIDNSEGKVDGIMKIKNRLGIPLEDISYVGDLMKDYQVAVEAGVDFIGSGYGWEIRRFPIADSVSDIATIIKLEGE